MFHQMDHSFFAFVVLMKDQSKRQCCLAELQIFMKQPSTAEPQAPLRADETEPETKSGSPEQDKLHCILSLNLCYAMDSCSSRQVLSRVRCQRQLCSLSRLEPVR